MPNPQQPELARSRKTPALDEHAVPGVLDGQPDVGSDAPRGPVPPENQPGHHPAEEQDRPPLDKFAAKLGTMEPEERREVLKDEPPSVVNPPPPATKRNALVGVAALVALVLAVIAGRRIRSRR